MAQVQSPEVQRMSRACGSEKENEVYCGKHHLDVFTYSDSRLSIAL